MQAVGNGLIQAVEWKDNMPVTAGTFKSARLIHCNEDGGITAHFISGDKTRDLVAGDDLTLAGVDVTITSGNFDIN